MKESEKRRFPRLPAFSAALITQAGQGWLSEVRDLSQGGARLARPQHWQTADDKHYCIYFIFDQETVIAVDASCVRENADDLGFAFEDGQETKVKDLLYESRFVDQDAP
ncbi:MAG TPA: PilZ domain-containing protein [Dokdonella sp.]|jgi:hypothetical protein|uniref:PilZ domain-containing protein n=1 Tax=Dokdonella sp. TaxID=2291710 RepID=UPI001B6ECFC0|nr:PilZ domain-containing protein [Dokdonella sp.]MBP6329112.1 PilZ domain-containing protein [Dokdonella sp.]HNV08159.1 PilZ domain-containing protein [Dokdonella sp.]